MVNVTKNFVKQTKSLLTFLLMFWERLELKVLTFEGWIIATLTLPTTTTTNCCKHRCNYTKALAAFEVFMLSPHVQNLVKNGFSLTNYEHQCCDLRKCWLIIKLLKRFFNVSRNVTYRSYKFWPSCGFKRKYLSYQKLHIHTDLYNHVTKYRFDNLKRFEFYIKT